MIATVRPAFWWITGGLLLLGIGLIYRRVPEFEFLAFDDDHNIVFNPHLGPLSWERVRWAWTDWSFTRRFMPLGWLGFATVYGWFGLDSGSWHGVNFAMHAAGSLLLWSILRRLAHGADGGARPNGWAETVAFLGAAFWAWHPLRVESVAWASGLLYGQAHLLCFAAFWCALQKRGGAFWAAAALTLYTASLLTYPIALGAAPIFGLLARWRGLSWREAWRGQMAVLCVAVAVFAANLAAQTWLSEVGQFTPAPTLAEFSVGARLVQAGLVWWHYFGVTAWPVDLTPVDTVLLDFAGYGGFHVGVAGVWFGWFALSVGWARARATVAPFLLAYACVLVPMLGLTQKPHFPSDRYGALAQAVLAAGLVMGLGRLTAGARRGWVAGLVGGLLVMAAMVSFRQTEIWRNSDRLWTHIGSRLGPGLPPSYAEGPRIRALALAGRLDEARAGLVAARTRYPGDAVWAQVAAQLAAIEDETAAVAAQWGLRAPPAPAALLHFELARERAAAGDRAAAAVHLAAMRRVAPEYYDRIMSPTGRPAR